MAVAVEASSILPVESVGVMSPDDAAVIVAVHYAVRATDERRILYVDI
jgi:hypothetical protein